MQVIYHSTATLARVLVKVLANTTVLDGERIPHRGPIIIVCNHNNYLDPIILVVSTRRFLSFVTKEELFRVPLLGGFFISTGVIPIKRRSADRAALRRAEVVLSSGGAICMFPEGTRSGGRGLKEGEPGTAIIALRSAAPVLPVAIWGTENVKLPRDLRHRTKIWVRFGPPIAFPERKRVTKEDVAAATAEIMAHIAELLPAQYRGVYGTARPGRVASAPPGR